ncbi:MAG TPA: tRNA lysidine(34) synthetase TilS [Burkholderiaceae bacterium]|nr:tRNA lysidine(34) synthetase TilS [Burkholderiaceae bacterium]
MASSRKPASRKAEAPRAARAANADAPLLAAFSQALRRLAQAPADPRFAVSSQQRAGQGNAAVEPAKLSLAVAFSGGCDSTVLLELATLARARRGSPIGRLAAIHVHHGLLPQADAWAEHARSHCASRHLEFILRRVRVVRSGRGTEDAARRARYTALADVARQQGFDAVMTAHHADDRIEGFLLQWLRGAGPQGLAGPSPCRPLDPGLPAGTRLLRPLLDVERSSIEAFARRHRLSWIEDPSNRSIEVDRSALRHEVLPTLAGIRRGFRRAAARSIDLVAEMAATLNDVALEDLLRCAADAGAASLRLAPWRALAEGRRAHVLRAWLARAGFEAPARGRLQGAIDALLAAPLRAAQRVDLGDATILCAHGVLRVERRDARHLRTARDVVAPAPDTARLRWDGEAEIAVPGWSGRLRFISTQGQGFDADWLRGAELEVRGRHGGERFKPHPARPSKTLKQVYQECGVAAPARRALPLVWAGPDLLYVAGVGADARRVGSGGRRVRLEWMADEAGQGLHGGLI